MAVGRHQPELLLPRHDVEPVEKGPALVLRHGVAGPGDHAPQEPGLHGEGARGPVHVERRVLVGRQPDQAEARGAAGELHPPVVEEREGHGLRRQLTDELDQLARGQRDGAALGHGAGNGDPGADLEIGGREAQPVLPGLDQDVGQNRERLARLDDVLQELECAQERLAGNLEVHRS